MRREIIKVKNKTFSTEATDEQPIQASYGIYLIETPFIP